MNGALTAFLCDIQYSCSSCALASQSWLGSPRGLKGKSDADALLGGQTGSTGGKSGEIVNCNPLGASATRQSPSKTILQV
jgi:hypothetical protein